MCERRGEKDLKHTHPEKERNRERGEGDKLGDSNKLGLLLLWLFIDWKLYLEEYLVYK